MLKILFFWLAQSVVNLYKEKWKKANIELQNRLAVITRNMIEIYNYLTIGIFQLRFRYNIIQILVFRKAGERKFFIYVEYKTMQMLI